MLKSKKVDLLFGVYIFCIVASEMLGIKTFRLTNFSWLHLNASVAILLLPIVFSINDIIIEVYGKERARSLVRSGLVAVFLTLVFAAIATVLPPSGRFLPTESAYDKVFTSTIRISIASLAAFAIAEVTDILVFVKIRQRLGKKALWLRNNVSNFIAQFLDTTIFMTLAFYGFSHSFASNITFLTSLIIPYWLIKCSMSVLETPLVYLGIRWLKGEE